MENEKSYKNSTIKSDAYSLQHLEAACTPSMELISPYKGKNSFLINPSMKEKKFYSKQFASSGIQRGKVMC
jgi:hypothetical protein